MSSPDDTGVHALVIGCGYLGRRVAAAWRADGRRVAALTRGRAGELARDGLEPVVGDVLDPASLAGLPAARAILYAVGFDRMSGQGMRDVYVNGLANVLTSARCSGPFVYVSSTSVYGQTAGEWVTEDSVTDPREASGRVVLEAEGVLRKLRPDAIILRFAGIYGPGRVLRRQALLAGEPLAGDADKWLNLIHVDDGVSAVLAAAERGQPGEVYQIADGEPVRRRDFYTLSADLLGGPPATFAASPPPAAEANRRVSNAKARAELGFAPQYPSYREGLRASIETPR